ARGWGSARSPGPGAWRQPRQRATGTRAAREPSPREKPAEPGAWAAEAAEPAEPAEPAGVAAEGPELLRAGLGPERGEMEARAAPLMTVGLPPERAAQTDSPRVLMCAVAEQLRAMMLLQRDEPRPSDAASEPEAKRARGGDGVGGAPPHVPTTDDYERWM